ncbi:MAG: ribonuclease HI family protein [Candidatus Marinimicrobia bacterium]|nr:ribonuclease HI family protein [Candidatus Neomarinimicrobiota bacterium]
MKLDQNEIEILKKLFLSDVKYKLNSTLSNQERSILENLRDKLFTSPVIEVFVDGASDLQNKIAGIGGVAYQHGQEVFRFADYIGEATNNQAEYQALIQGLNLLKDLNAKQIKVFMDSELVVKQINGEYRVKHKRMKPLYKKSTDLLSIFDDWVIEAVPREKNKIADILSKKGMARGIDS